VCQTGTRLRESNHLQAETGFDHGWGQQYLYEVRTTERVQAQDLSVLKHEELPWLTLITCLDFDESSGLYPWRTIVQAVQVDIIDE
jgi:sortase (surface protein transpeptidase)